MVSLTDPCRDIRVMSRPQLYSIGVATLEWCRYMKILLLNISFSFDHISFVATSFFCCLGHPGHNLFLQVTTKLPIATPIFSCDFNSSCRLVSSGFFAEILAYAVFSCKIKF